MKPNGSQFYVNPSLSGQWVAGQLYLVDVEAAKHHLVSGPVGFYLAELNRGHVASAPTADQILELVAAGILLERAPKSSQRAEIETIEAKDVAQATSPQAILETGNVEMRLVASMSVSSTIEGA